MTQRVIGIALVITGVILACLGIFGALRGPASAAITDALMRSVENHDFVFSSWLSRWQLWGVGVACAGAAITIGGIVLVLDRRWGVLVVAATLFAAALVPWIMQVLQLARYPFEDAELPETFVLLALSTIAVWSYFRLGRVATDA